MRYRELTTPELERKLEDLVADQIRRRLELSRAQMNAIQSGIKKGRDQYIANVLHPGREARKRELLQRRQEAQQAQQEAGTQPPVAGQDVSK
jgi:hypothetical protein